MTNSVSLKKISFIIALSASFMFARGAELPSVHAQTQDLEAPSLETAEEMRRRLAEEKKKLEAIENQKRGVKGQVQQLDKERARLTKLLINYAQRIQESETALSKLEARLISLRRKDTKLRASMKERSKAIAEMLGLLQRMGRNPPPIMATHRDDALKMVRSAMLMSNMLPKLKNQADTLKTEINNLTQLQASITKQSEQLRVQNAEMESDRIRVKELATEKKQRILSHNQELARFEQRAKEHSKSVSNLGQLIKRVDRDLKEKTELGAYEKQLIEDEALAKQKTSTKATVELSPDEKKTMVFSNLGRIEPALPFAKVKHTLSLPARGRILRSFGDRMKYGNTSKGISIATRPNAQITSPSDGWIVYSGKFRKYGQLLIINAGGGYHILLAGLKRIDVKSAQFVLAGEPIGEMADQPKTQKDGKKSTEPVLYIEFRLKGKPIDPSPWWAKQLASKNPTN